MIQTDPRAVAGPIRAWCARLFATMPAAAGAGADVSRVTRRAAWLVFAALTLLYVYAACIELGLSADGAYFFMRALDDGRILVPEPSRVFASVIQMWPVTLAVRAGVTSLPVLKALFHAALYLPFLAAFLICVPVTRALRDDALLLFPLASHLLVSLPASSILAGQNEVLAVVVWPALFLALRERLSRMEGWLLLVLLVLMTRLYESAVLPAMLLFALTAVRQFTPGCRQRGLFAAAAVLSLVTPVLAVYSTFADFTATSQGDFLSALSMPILRHPQMHPMLSLSAFSLALLAAAVFAPVSLRKWLLAGALAGAVAGIALGLWGLTAAANTSFNLRTLTFTLLTPLMLLAVLWHMRRPVLPAAVLGTGAAVMLLLVAGYAVSWQGWVDYRRAFRAELARDGGYVNIEETPLAMNAQRWRWTPSVLSVLWSGGCVRTMLWTPGNVDWPVHLRQQFPLQAYVQYDAGLGAPAEAQCARGSVSGP